jgi:6-pyruvoyltetrahydropterin/6-carboxytetrahydropterin synthase
MGTYEIRVKDRYSAVHRLKLPDGSLEPLHGHDWRVEAVFRGQKLDGLEMLIDFEIASAVLRDVLADLRRANLNMLPAFADHNPTAEVVARLIYNRLRDRLGSTAPLAAVYVEEAPGCIAGYVQAGL